MAKRKPKEQEQDTLSYRVFRLAAEPIAEQRAVPVIAATENPVPMPDWERMEMVPEVLLMSGCELPKDRRLPLLNSHDRWNNESVIGSGVNVRIEGGQLEATAEVSSTAEKQWTLIKEGHLRDLSAGYHVTERKYVPKGKTETIGGKSFTGPVNVATRWRPFEISFTPIGADEQAKRRGFESDPFVKERPVKVTPLLRLALESRGMPLGLDDEKAVDWLCGRGMPKDHAAIEEWVTTNPDKLQTTAGTGNTATNTGAGPTDTAHHGTTATATPPAETRSIQHPPVDVEAIAKAAAERATVAMQEQIAVREKFVGSVRKFADKYNLGDQTTEFVEKCGGDLTRAYDMVIEAHSKKQQENGLPFAVIEHGAAQQDKHCSLIRAAFLNRTVMPRVKTKELRDELLPASEQPQGWQRLARLSLYDFARHCLEATGVRTEEMSREQVAKTAMAMPLTPSYETRGYGVGYHFTGSFNDLTLDAINKTLLAAYTEAPRTWNRVFRQAASVADFKTIHRIRLGEAPDPMLWPDNTAPKEIAFNDERVSYAVEAYAETASFSWRLLINDDMDALNRIPQLMGNAFSRMVNRLAWTQITANGTMGYDSQALFSTATGNRKKANLISATASPTVATLQDMVELMMLQVGVNTPENNASDAILGLMPRFLVGPPELYTNIMQLTRSSADPTANLSSAVYNPWGGLEPVIEPILSANSSTAFYLFADTAQIDTVEVTFLQGYETPQTESWVDNETSALKYKITQALAAQAIDHRGMVKHTGS